jgi:Carboxypeptidase regulatory-like domain
MKRCFLFLALFLCPLFGLAQSTSATISGGVTDPSGNFVLDANVQIVNDATGVIYSARTNNSGMYLVPILPPGHYHVQASKPGFKTIIKADVVLNVQSALALNFTLPIGATSESVTVDAASLPINTTDASVSTVINRNFVENIPLNGRSFQDLIQLTPGVVTQSPQSNTNIGVNGDFSVNGQRTESNYYTVDGVAANINAGNGTGTPQSANAGTISASTVLGTTQSLVSVDALQEFRVQSSTYSAEYGRSPGGQFSFLTRSGTNVLHGSAYDYLRNNYFDANDWFNDYYGKPISALRQNDFGGTIGGPVWIPHLYNGRDATFFFISYEGLRLTQPQPATIQYVPDTFMRQEAAKALQPVFNAFPMQNGFDYGSASNPNLAEFIDAYSLPSSVDSTGVRLDHTFSQKLTVFFRYAETPSSTKTRFLSSITDVQNNAETYTLGATSAFTANFSNELRAGYADTWASSIGSLDSFGGATPIDLPTALGIGSYQGTQSQIDVNIPSIGSSNLDLTNGSNHNKQWNIVDTATFSLRSHQLKLGIDYRHLSSSLIQGSPYVYAYYASNQHALNNVTDYLGITKWKSAVPLFNETAAFVNDAWRISPALTLSMGIRWEVDPPPTEATGDDAYTLTGSLSNPSSLQLAPQGTRLWATTWFNFAPRIGLAWIVNPSSGRETVFRAGGGVFFDTDDQLATQGYTGIGFRATNTPSESPIPVTSSQLTFTPSPTAPYTSATLYAFPPHLQRPYTLQWNASLEQSLGPANALTVTYVAANGRRLIQLVQSSFSKLNPNFGLVDYIQTGVTSNYQSLQLQFQRSVAHGLHALASYTWSHSIDFGSTGSAFPASRGPSDFDVRNNLQAGMAWDLPSRRGDRFAKYVINGWGVDSRLLVRSSFPITILGNLLTDPNSATQYYSGVNLVPGQPLYIYKSIYPGKRIINRAAFTLPSGMSEGNLPRNQLRGFDATQLNLAIRRDFRIADRATLQFRAETFNLLNHPDFGQIDTAITDATFGQAIKSLNQSLGTMSAQYQQGGARSMQFTLRASF